MIRVGAFDEFGKPRTAQFWDAQVFMRSFGNAHEPGQGWLLPPPGTERLPEAMLREPTLRERLEWETDLLGFAVSDHPLKLHDQVAWETYCPVSKLGQHVGEIGTMAPVGSAWDDPRTQRTPFDRIKHTGPKAILFTEQSVPKWIRGSALES